MKKILLIMLIAVSVVGCLDNTPKCGDKVVKDLVIKLSRERLIEAHSYLNLEVQKVKDIYGIFGLDIDIESVIFKELQKEGYSFDDINMLLEVAKYDKNKLYTTNATLDTIMTTDINKSIKKCSCKATAKFNELGIGMNAVYDAQLTDNGKKVYVRLLDIEFNSIPKEKTT